MSWWGGVFREISDPRWFAALLQATLAGAIAFIGALALFARQLRHDVHLIGQQITADRRSSAARALGKAFILAYERSEKLLLGDDGDAVRYFLKNSDPPGLEELTAAIRDSRLELGLPEFPAEVAHTWHATWGASRRALDGALPLRYDDANGLRAVANASLIRAWLLARGALFDYGRALIEWDGQATFPEREALSPGWAPAPRETEAFEKWSAEVGRAFRDRIFEEAKREESAEPNQ